jgi:hypothetical protein
MTTWTELVRQTWCHRSLMVPFGSLELLSIIDLKKLMAKDHNLITKVFQSLTPLPLELNVCRDVRAILGG